MIRRRHADVFPRDERVIESALGLTPSCLEGPIIELYDAVATLLGGSERKIVQFIGVRGGEGTSTVARDFARAAAGNPGRSVLLLDARGAPAGGNGFAAVGTTCNILDALQNGGRLEDALVQDTASRLWLAVLTGEASSAMNTADLPAFDDLWRELRERFDLVVVDSPPAIRSADGIAVARKVNGVVLLFEAEKTRLAMAKHASEKIVKNGGNLLGVVLNRRKYHIPQLIYRLL